MKVISKRRFRRYRCRVALSYCWQHSVYPSTVLQYYNGLFMLECEKLVRKILSDFPRLK